MKRDKRVGVGIGVILLKDGKILLGKRHSDNAKADTELHGEGTWTMPGGKLNFGESLEEGVYREVLEETGIQINKNNLTFISLSNDIVPDAHFITIGFLCENFHGTQQVKEPDEIVEWNWFPLDVLPKPLYFPSARVIENYKTRAVYKNLY